MNLKIKQPKFICAFLERMGSLDWNYNPRNILTTKIEKNYTKISEIKRGYKKDEKQCAEYYIPFDKKNLKKSIKLIFPTLPTLSFFE